MPGARGPAAVISGFALTQDIEPDYHEFNNEYNMKQMLAKHIFRLKKDIEWSNNSWFGFFVNKPLKDEKIQALDKMMTVLNEKTINIDNYMEIFNKIEIAHPNLHEGVITKESHKIMMGIKLFYQKAKNMELKEDNHFSL